MNEARTLVRFKGDAYFPETAQVSLARPWVVWRAFSRSHALTASERDVVGTRRLVARGCRAWTPTAEPRRQREEPVIATLFAKENLVAHLLVAHRLQRDDVLLQAETL